MTTLRVTRPGGEARGLEADAMEQSASELDGALAGPGDDAYAEATSIWNGMITRRPTLVVRAASTEDVVRTVNFARDNEVELSIRGGGHRIAGLSLSDAQVKATYDPTNLFRVNRNIRR